MHLMTFLDTNRKWAKKSHLIENLEQKYRDYSNKELKQCTETFKNSIQKGGNLDSILVDAFAVVREAAQRVLGLFPFPVQLNALSGKMSML